MDSDVRKLVEAIHASPKRIALALTGGGTSAAGLLLALPGGSKTVLEVQVPYDSAPLVEYLGQRPAQFCSLETACLLAERAYERATWLAPGQTIIGIGCTASLATDRPKKGDHRFHVGTRSAVELKCHSLTLQKGARDRETEENLLAVVLLNALAQAVGTDTQLKPPLLPGETIQLTSELRADQIEALAAGALTSLCIEPDGRTRPDSALPALLVSGAFNPLHEGHRGLAATAERLTGRTAAFELSVLNVDKQPLTAPELRRRAQQFQWRSPLWLTRAATFIEKASLFPGSTFVVGADTAERIVAPRYYQDSNDRVNAALEHIRSRNCRFLVAGRVDKDQRFLKVGHLDIPSGFKSLFDEIAEEHFRRDVSATELRRQGQRALLGGED
jgi:hypothetical protein